MARSERTRLRRRICPAYEPLDGRVLLSLATAGSVGAPAHGGSHTLLQSQAEESAVAALKGRIMTPELRQRLESTTARNGPARTPSHAPRPPASAAFFRNRPRDSHPAWNLPSTAGKAVASRVRLQSPPSAPGRLAARSRVASPTRYHGMTLSTAPGPVRLAPADARYIALSIPQNADLVTQAIVDLTNHVRAENSVPALHESSALMEGAQLHSADMARLDRMLHEIPGVPLRSLPDRAAFVHYDYQLLGENIAFNQADAASVVGAWMNSPPHRENMLDPDLTDIGVGLAWNRRGEPYYTMMLGKPA